MINKVIVTSKRLIIGGFLLLQLSAHGQQQKGKASFYADKFEGRPTANGEIYAADKFTAAHPTLPFGTLVKVTNLENNKTTIVRINDRGPFVAGRIIDLSKTAAAELDLLQHGVAKVSLKVLHPDTVYPIDGAVFYNIDVTQAHPDGFGVQVGSYVQQGNLISLSEKIIKKYKRHVLIQQKITGDKESYSVIIGNFKNRKEAINFKNILSIEFSDSYIVDFSKF